MLLILLSENFSKRVALSGEGGGGMTSEQNPSILGPHIFLERLKMHEVARESVCLGR